MHEPVKLSEVKDIAQYEKIRPEFRKEVMQAKDLRRIRVGPDFTFLFENHLTVLYQVQEMVRAERMVDDSAIQHEVDTYNELLPSSPHGLGASLLIEYDDRSVRQVRLRELLGLEKHVWLQVGTLDRIQGQFDTRQWDDQRISSVQYVQFDLDDTHRQQWMDAARAGQLKLIVDHPHYSHEAVLTESQAAALAEDFS